MLIKASPSSIIKQNRTLATLCVRVNPFPCFIHFSSTISVAAHHCSTSAITNLSVDSNHASCTSLYSLAACFNTSVFAVFWATMRGCQGKRKNCILDCTYIRNATNGTTLLWLLMDTGMHDVAWPLSRTMENGNFHPILLKSFNKSAFVGKKHGTFVHRVG